MLTSSRVVRNKHQFAGRGLNHQPIDQVRYRRSRIVASVGGMSISKSARRAQFVLFGDSLTQAGFSEGGWAGQLAYVYQ
eukprot:9381375-Pyramimonas_sp.AAC.1